MPNFRILVKGNEFGETYHTAVAVITSRGNVKPQWNDTTNTVNEKTTDDQKRFLGKVALYMQLLKNADSQVFFKQNTIDAVGVRGGQDEALSSNTASTSSAEAFGKSVLEKEKKLIRDVFLSNPVLGEQLPGQAGLDVNLRKIIIQELVQRNIDTVNEKVVVFNRQQPDSPNRNLNKKMLVAIIKSTAANYFLVNSSSNHQKAFNDVLATVPANVKQGKTFTHLGEFIQERKKQDGTVDDALKKADSFTFQLNVLDVLNRFFKTIRAYGVKSGALDGPAFIDIPTIYCLGEGDNDGRVKYIGLYYYYKNLVVP